ncbi:MAG: HD domain-containing protein [Syntrophales bacterium]|nr:HD domain-containing protein [Syntrophales bacterium]
MKKSVFLKDIRAGDKVDDFFLVAEKNSAFSQKGTPYLNIRLKDRTGEMDAKVWENVDKLDQVCKKGDYVFVRSRAVTYRNVIQLSLLDLRPASPEEIDPLDYFPTIEGDVEVLFNELCSYMDRVKDPYLAALLHSFFDDEEFREKFKRAPAAKGFHHNCLGGLLEHTLSVVRLLDFALEHYRGLKRDLVLVGGILHDVGKVREFSYNGLVDYTDEGRLIGHITIGIEMINEKISKINDFPWQLALELRHIVLSHHGSLEYGSPKRPKTLEALMVHQIDDLDAKINAFQEFIKDAPDNDSPWTPYHRLLDRYIYRGPREESESEEGSF